MRRFVSKSSGSGGRNCLYTGLAVEEVEVEEDMRHDYVIDPSPQQLCQQTFTPAYDLPHFSYDPSVSWSVELPPRALLRAQVFYWRQGNWEISLRSNLTCPGN